MPNTPRIPAKLPARHNREKLYEEVWAEPAQQVAKKYGISDVALAKNARKLGVLGDGFWVKVNDGLADAFHSATPSSKEIKNSLRDASNGAVHSFSTS